MHQVAHNQIIKPISIDITGAAYRIAKSIASRIASEGELRNVGDGLGARGRD